MPTVKPTASIKGYLVRKGKHDRRVVLSPRRLVKSKPPSSPDPHPWIAQIRRLQKGFKFTQIEFAARLINCTPRSLILWKNGRAPNPAVLNRLKELDRLYQALAHLMPPEEVGPWMKRTNEYLDPLTPIEVLDRGEIDRLWHIIHNVGSGMPT